VAKCRSKFAKMSNVHRYSRRIWCAARWRTIFSCHRSTAKCTSATF
jgi:hypothetical protein